MSKTLKFSVLWVFMIVSCATPIRSAEVDIDHGEGWRDMIGTWSSHHAQTGMVLSIEPNGHALLMFIHDGSHSTGRTTWRPFYGGILVDGLPRLRLWPGRPENHESEVRAELEYLSTIS